MSKQDVSEFPDMFLGFYNELARLNPKNPPKFEITLPPEVMELLKSIADDLDYLAMRKDLG